MSGKPKQNIIAIVYDFDGTLSPDNMQDKSIFGPYNIKPNTFWAKANQLVSKHQYDRMLAYLKLLISEPAFLEKPLTSEWLKKQGASSIEYFDGVESYFENLKKFIAQIPEAKQLGINVEHYIVSSGLKSILDGCSIAKHFKKIYACEFEYENNRPVFPKIVINDTNKTQFLFRINKGKLDLSEDINSHMPEEDRPIPFRNMIYIGDGHTDIPSMTVTQKSGGHAIAVFSPEKGVSEEIKSMVRDGRADHFAPADYSEGKLLVRIIQKAVRKIIQDISYRDSSGKSKDWVRKNKK